MAPQVTPSSKPAKDHLSTPSKTPQFKHRLHFPNPKTPNANHTVPTEHPVEVIGRIRDYPDRKDKPSSSLEVINDGRSVRVRTDIGYRDFSLDGASVSEDEDLGGFYKRFVESRIDGVRLGAKCTIMMYGPTGSGKSHTMFGCAKQPGIVYRALRDILGDGEDGKENNGIMDDGGFGVGLFVQVAVMEIYNEEIYDLLGGSGSAVGFSKGNVPKARLEVMGKKVKNAAYITGNDARKISKEVAKVEKRRIVKSTLCNERSSRSHCLIILDVPAVGGRLMLVDMAGSENIEQAGQIGFEAKMQTAKINQGNVALKRVVESIANGDSHVPFRDSKLTMILQDSFEDDKSKILMILCASPDPKEMHKTISTFEYGAKAKCIVRIAHVATPREATNSEEASSALLGSRIAAMNQFIYKLQMENKVKEKERDDARKALKRKEDEVAELRKKLVAIEGRGAAAREEEIKSKVDERTLILRLQLEKMEAQMDQQQKELAVLRQRLGGLEEQDKAEKDAATQDFAGSRFMKRLTELYTEGGDQGMEKSMEIDMGDQPTTIHEVKEIIKSHKSTLPAIYEEEDSVVTGEPKKFCLSTVFEANEEEEDAEGVAEEVEKGVVEENKAQHGARILEEDATSRSTRIQNIFRLCGNHRELAHQVKIPTPSKKKSDVGQTDSAVEQSPIFDGKRSAAAAADKENSTPGDVHSEGLVDVFVKWETSKEVSGNLIKKTKISNEASLTDLRKLIETHLAEENNQQHFTFLLLGDPTGAPVSRDKEGTLTVSELPVCNNQLRGYLACLRPVKKNGLPPSHLPLGTLENKLAAALHPTSEGFSPKIGQKNVGYLSGLRA